MTAASLLDILVGDDNGDADPARAAQAVDFARSLVDSTLADWQRVLGYEEQFSTAEYVTPATDDKINRLLDEIYRAWAAEAEQVLERIRRLRAAGHRLEHAEALEKAYGCARARLELTPEMIARATQQARQGQVIPLKELRDELRARVRG